MTNHHDNNIRKWIHRFNDCGIDGIISKKHNHPAQKITDDIENENRYCMCDNDGDLAHVSCRRQRYRCSRLSALHTAFESLEFYKFRYLPYQQTDLNH
jgi:hypothetical protein